MTRGPEVNLPRSGFRRISGTRTYVSPLLKINADGLIAEDRSYFDNYEYMKQLGLIK